MEAGMNLHLTILRFVMTENILSLTNAFYNSFATEKAQREIEIALT